jgi:hypothetical protein
MKIKSDIIRITLESVGIFLFTVIIPILSSIYYYMLLYFNVGYVDITMWFNDVKKIWYMFYIDGIFFGFENWRMHLVILLCIMIYKFIKDGQESIKENC